MKSLPLLASSFAVITALSTPFFAHAGTDDFAAGPVFDNYGKHAPVPGVSVSPQQQFKVAFDVAKGADAGKVNRKFDSLARFINMHVANGAKQENIQLALVVHGSATLDVINNATYQKRKGEDNGNLSLLRALIDKGVRVIVCGQSSAANDVSTEMLIEGVEMDLSAMTAHARLSEQGYSTNPF
jgi:intracellular sulfur oxidation DsrE/DsrF family protein